jgi:hypothetical protein
MGLAERATGLPRALLRRRRWPAQLDRQLDVGNELRDGGRRYEVERVEQPTTPYVLGSAWVRLIEPP